MVDLRNTNFSIGYNKLTQKAEASISAELTWFSMVSFFDNYFLYTY